MVSFKNVFNALSYESINRCLKHEHQVGMMNEVNEKTKG